MLVIDRAPRCHVIGLRGEEIFCSNSKLGNDQLRDALQGLTQVSYPVCQADFGLSTDEKTKLDADSNAINLLPPAQRRRLIANDDYLIRLPAHARYFQRHQVKEIPLFSPEFFDLMCKIYGAAFIDWITRQPPILAIALLMLCTYSLHCPDLQQALTLAQRQFKFTSSALLAMRKTLQLVNTFLDSHGLQHDHPGCCLWITPPDLSGECSLDFSVQVRLGVACSEADHASQLTWAEFKDKTSKASASLLQQLTDYPLIERIDKKAAGPKYEANGSKQSRRR